MDQRYTMHFNCLSERTSKLSGLMGMHKVRGAGGRGEERVVVTPGTLRRDSADSWAGMGLGVRAAVSGDASNPSFNAEH